MAKFYLSYGPDDFPACISGSSAFRFLLDMVVENSRRLLGNTIRTGWGSPESLRLPQQRRANRND
jgi:hypothetical protein